VGDDLRRGGMFDPAGALFCHAGVDGQDLNEKLFQGIVAEDDTFCRLFSLCGQGDGLVWGVIDELSLGESPQGLSDRRAADVQASGDLFAAGYMFVLNNMVYCLQVIFKTGTEADFFGHGGLFWAVKENRGCCREMARKVLAG